jgi:hypothetical protein
MAAAAVLRIGRVSVPAHPPSPATVPTGLADRQARPTRGRGARLAPGTAGVDAARERERMGRDGSLEERLHDWLVRWLAERRHELLSGVDTGTRYELVAEWARDQAR